MKYEINYLGFNTYLNDYTYSKLDNLNESMMEIIRSNESLKAIKSVNFQLDEESPTLMVSLILRNNEKIVKEFRSHIDEDALFLSEDYIMAYFGEDKHQFLQEILKDFNGKLPFDFLESKEPLVLNQLKINYLLDSAPNVIEGAEFTDSDFAFFQEIIKENS